MWKFLVRTKRTMCIATLNATWFSLSLFMLLEELPSGGSRSSAAVIRGRCKEHKMRMAANDFLFQLWEIILLLSMLLVAILYQALEPGAVILKLKALGSTGIIVSVTVSLLKSCIYWRSCFLIPGYHYNPPVFTDHFTWCHNVTIKFFLLYGQKSGHLRQSNHPPLFARRRSASY